MDIRQGLNDLTIRLKEDRKTQVITICIVLALIFYFANSQPTRRTYSSANANFATTAETIGDSAAKNAYSDLITSIGSDLDDLKKANMELRDTIQKQHDDAEQTKGLTTEIIKKMLQRMSDLENSVANQGNGQNGAIAVQPEPPVEMANDDLEPFGNFEKEEVAPPAEPKQERLAVIGEGDAVRVKLLAGVNAPTDGTPYPVVLELIDDITGPDGSSLNVGNARLVAAAQGSLTDSRALFRLHTLNIRMPNGARQIVDVDGWIVGEDGTIGMEGILIDPIGKVLAGVFAAGTVEGVGEGLSNNGTTVHISGAGITTIKDGDLWKNATGEGLEDAADLWSDIVRGRLNKMVPHVRVLSGRTATAVFSKSQTIPGLYDALEEGEETFVALD